MQLHAPEAVVLLTTVLETLRGVPSDATTTSAAALYQRIGVLEAEMAGGSLPAGLGSRLLACFEACRAAGADQAAMGRARVAIAGFDVASAPAAYIRAAAVQMCLVEEAKIVAATTYRSRDAIQVVREVLTLAFDNAQAQAADAGAGVVYRALVALQGAVVRDLAARSRPLPRIATFAYGTNLPTAVLATILYDDADRADEIRAENGIFHPLFAPASIRALTA